MLSSSPDLPTIASGLQSVFPSLIQVAPLAVLGLGFGSLVVETAGGVVFRLARNRTAGEGHAREVRFLPVLRQRSSVPIPNPEWYAPPSTQFSFGIIGYHKLPGTPLTPAQLRTADQESIASALGRFLWDLHNFPIGEAQALGVSGPDEQSVKLESLRDRSLPIWRQLLTGGEYRLLTAWWDSLIVDPQMGEYAPAVCHGDMWYENILMDDAGRTITGILDFENVEIGDPAQDFATQLYLGEAFATRVLYIYRALGGGVDAQFLHRMQRFWELREAVIPEDPAEFEDQIRKLRSSPILKRPG